MSDAKTDNEIQSFKGVASVELSTQIGQYEWETWTISLEVSETTTVGEIVRWIKKNNNNMIRFDFNVHTLDQLKP